MVRCFWRETRKKVGRVRDGLIVWGNFGVTISSRRDHVWQERMEGFREQMWFLLLCGRHHTCFQTFTLMVLRCVIFCRLVSEFCNKIRTFAKDFRPQFTSAIYVRRRLSKQSWGIEESRRINRHRSFWGSFDIPNMFALAQGSSSDRIIAKERARWCRYLRRNQSRQSFNAITIDRIAD